METVSVEHARSGRSSKVVGAKVQGAMTTSLFPETNRSIAPINGNRTSVRQGQGAVSTLPQGQDRRPELRPGALHDNPTSYTRVIAHYQPFVNLTPIVEFQDALA